MAAGAVLAGALLASLERDGVAPDPTLRLLQGAPDRGARPLDGPGDLGRLHEELASPDERRRRGAWYTPAPLAEEVVALAVPDRAAAARGPVVDPACGGGAFLLAAAERLHALGCPAPDAVAQLRGRDVDPLAVAVTEASLWWWSARREGPVRPSVEVGDSLLDGGDDGAGTIVGNPPFLGQLRAGTALDPARRDALRSRFGGALRAYTDPAWLFALHAVDAVAPGGRVALVQPRSFLAARDARIVRERIERTATLVTTLVPSHAGFDAAVDVCVPLLERTADGHPGPSDWVAGLADAGGVPAVHLPAGPVLGDRATTHAGFRDEFYGFAGAVSDGGDGPRLVTAGAIDPLRLLDRPQRFAGRRWSDPRVDVSALAGRAARWARIQADPKVLVSTQTRVIEAVADPEGALVASVPVIVVRPREAGDVWRLAAALHAPAASAWLLRRSAGTARSADACRPTAALLAALPLPIDAQAWDEAARLASAASAGRASIEEVARAADRAYGVDDPSVLSWWDGRRPQR